MPKSHLGMRPDCNPSRGCELPPNEREEVVAHLTRRNSPSTILIGESVRIYGTAANPIFCVSDVYTRLGVESVPSIECELDPAGVTILKESDADETRQFVFVNESNFDKFATHLLTRHFPLARKLMNAPYSGISDESDNSNSRAYGLLLS